LGGIRYSFVIPVYNEVEILPVLYEAMSVFLGELDGSAEVLLIDDGSNDGSMERMLQIHQNDSRFRVIQLSRNFGHQIALTAGLDIAEGDAVIIMDADLQDPLAVVHQLIEKWHAGYEIVYTIREKRDGESAFKRGTAFLFYRLLQRMTDVDIPLDAGDFRLVDRKAVEAFKTLHENSRYLRGMFAWMGFRQTSITYTRATRKLGKTKYSFRKMLRLALDGVFSFSRVPLRALLLSGVVIALLSLLTGLFLVLRPMGAWAGQGVPILLLAMAFWGGIQLIAVGVLGEYIGRIHDNTKQRPLYFIRSIH